MSKFFKKLKQFDIAAIKLSAFYVVIVLAISASFSVVLFNISSNEIDRGLGRQDRALRSIPSGPTIFPVQNLENIRADQLQESGDRLRLNLIYFNLLILILSSASSYFLARLTLKPIEEAMETQNRFTADASHELRTPLTAMRTEIEVALRDRELGLNESKKLFESNLEEIGKLESLSSALLKLAKNGDTKLALEKVNLAEIITEAYEKVEREAEKKSIMIDFDANKYGDLEINGDRLSLTELFVILLDNAIKYSSEKSKISINIEKDHDKTIIRVKDHGVGINHSDLPYIFNRFYRADSSRSKEKVSGYGLGLSIAKQIVELHSGNITVVSKPGKGTEFTVKI